VFIGFVVFIGLSSANRIQPTTHVLLTNPINPRNSTNPINPMLLEPYYAGTLKCLETEILLSANSCQLPSDPGILESSNPILGLIHLGVIPISKYLT
jgi:hypothetical protein